MSIFPQKSEQIHQADTPRRSMSSLRVHQDHKQSKLRKYYILIICLFISFVAVTFFVDTINTIQDYVQDEQGLAIVDSTERLTVEREVEGGQLPTHRNQETKGYNLSETYLSLFCSDCNEKDIVVLETMLNLMQKEQGRSEVNKKYLKTDHNGSLMINKLYHATMMGTHSNGQEKGEPIIVTLQSLQLKVVKHERLTSVEKRSGIFNTITSLFWPRDYDRIQRIFWEHNRQVWQGNGMYLTVTTDSLMHPIAFKITLPMKVTAELLVFGLNIEGAINLVQRTFSHMLLGRYHMVSEWNYLECQSSECQQGYAMILFVMNPLQLLSLQVVELEGQR